MTRTVTRERRRVRGGGGGGESCGGAARRGDRSRGGSLERSESRDRGGARLDAARTLTAVGVYIVHDLRDREGLVRPLLRRAALRLAASDRAPLQRAGTAYLRSDPPGVVELPGPASALVARAPESPEPVVRLLEPAVEVVEPEADAAAPADAITSPDTPVGEADDVPIARITVRRASPGDDALNHSSHTAPD